MKFQSAIDHSSAEYDCPLSQNYLSKCGLSKCKYLGQKILRQIVLEKATRCDGCGMYPIHGILRFKCCVCEDFDLCNNCKNNNLHPDHLMKIESCVTEMSHDVYKKYMQLIGC